MPNDNVLARQIAKTITIPSVHANYINWQRVGDERAQLACHLDVRRQHNGDVVITWYWVPDADNMPLMK